MGTNLDIVNVGIAVAGRGGRQKGQIAGATGVGTQVDLLLLPLAGGGGIESFNEGESRHVRGVGHHTQLHSIA